MELTPDRIAQLIREDRARFHESQEKYATRLGLSQTQISKLEKGQMLRVSGAVLLVLQAQFRERLSARSVPTPRDGSRQPIPEGWEDIVENDDLRAAWARVHRLWVLSKKYPKRKAGRLFPHLSQQSEVLLENAERDLPASARRRAKAAGDEE